MKESWITLLTQAKQQGLTVKEVKQFLNSKKQIKTIAKVKRSKVVLP
jgi:DNA-binding transcriptional MerR regulator